MVPEVREQMVEGSKISIGRSFPGVVSIPPIRSKEEREEGIGAAVREAAERERDPSVI